MNAIEIRPDVLNPDAVFPIRLTIDGTFVALDRSVKTGTYTTDITVERARKLSCAFLRAAQEIESLTEVDEGDGAAVHWAIIPFQAACGADEPNQRTASADNWGHITCPDCIAVLTKELKERSKNA